MIANFLSSFITLKFQMFYIIVGTLEPPGVPCFAFMLPY